MYTDTCPVCDSSEWQYSETNFDEDFLINVCYCEVCGSEWKERFVFVDKYDIVDNRDQ